tara:strand:- start:1774 stop:2103 length:330 start_codon:yes stop_codon:yes gene_type:complete
MTLLDLINYLGAFDPSILFGLSLFPYLIFIYYLWKSKKFTKTIILGYSFTLFFVFITILFSILAKINFDKTLVEIDLYHGLAESFLTISDLIILYGFFKLLEKEEIKNS